MLPLLRSKPILKIHRMARARTTPTLILLSFLLASPAARLLAQAHPLTEAQRQEFLHKLSEAAIERTHHTVRYDPAYVRISYPGGDVPSDTGVCTDEVIRSYRALGVDRKKKFTRTCRRTSGPTPTICAGDSCIPIQTSITGEFPI